jgi:hypothetical protein
MSQDNHPQMTFTEAELKCLPAYMNFVNSQAEFKVKAPQMQEFIRLTSEVIKHLKKCEAHIFEITKHYKEGE